MDPKHFDKLARTLSAIERRHLLAMLPGAVATVLVGADAESASSKKKKRKRKREKKQHQRYKKWKRRNSQMCVTYENRIIRCWSGKVCCDPSRSIEAGCANPGYPVCCENFNYLSNYRCCSAPTLGNKGACPDGYPVCCTDRCCAPGSSCGDPNANCRVYTEQAQGAAYRDLEVEPREIGGIST